MTSPVVTIVASDDLNRAQGLMSDRKVSALGVVDAPSSLIGVLSRSDLLRIGRIQAGSAPKASLLTLPHQTISSVMATPVQTVDAEVPLETAAQLMVKHRVHRIFITQNQRPIGVISTKDIMRAVSEKRVTSPIGEYMSSPVFTIRTQEPISLATERLERAKVSGLVVVEDGWPVGIFAQREALLSKDLPRTTPTEDVMNSAILCLSGQTRMFRAAQQAHIMDARRIIVVDGNNVRGILTGLDFAKVAS